MDARWARLQELFSQAVDLPIADRAEFVRRQTQGDRSLHDELMDLLAHDSGRATGPLTQALGAALDATTRDRRSALLGRVVGHYKLTAVLGHGGTGTVYLGERADRQYSAQVAVKIIDTTTVQGDLGMRFRAERQILASLNHPNIARLIDAGETDEAQPYLIMEYVHGVPLDRYCDRHQLDVRKRLELFLQVCAAVEYAHQNLVVHRDLKPANILVTAEGTPKLLDFGIAKLLDAGEAASYLALTRMNDRLLTPEYASPEQILGRPVTTASDVYALGVVLYELLTGSRPYAVPVSASQLELERSICVTDPQRPSTTVRRRKELPPPGESTMATLASARGLTPERLEKRLSGDIDAIVMRALRKEPQHRYGSIEQLAADVRRYLAREPVVARQGTWVYYSQRFVRRHAFGVSVSGAFVAFVIAFGIAMSAQTRRIAAERDRATKETEVAERVNSFMLNGLAAAEPFGNQGREITAGELLEKWARSIQGELTDQPEVRARLLETIGRAFRRQGYADRAVAYLEDSVRTRQSASSSLDPALGSTLTELAVALKETGRFEDSDRVFKRALAISRSAKDHSSADYARLLADLGRLELSQGRLENADKLLKESLELTHQILGPRHPELAAILMEISSLRAWQDDLQAAERNARDAVNIYRDTLPDLHPDRVLADYRLAEVLYLLGRIDEAALLYERSLDAQRRLYGDDSLWVASTMDSLARTRMAQNRVSDAESLARQALLISVAKRKFHVDTGFLMSSLGQILAKQKKYTEAERHLRDALEIFAKTVAPDHQYVASAEYLLGDVLLATNHLVDAEATLTASMNRWKRTDAPAWRAARSASALGEALYRQGKKKDAEKYLLEGYQALTAETGADADTRNKARQRVVDYYVAMGQKEKLNELMLVDRELATPMRNRPN